jgi:hypothetical protein
VAGRNLRICLVNGLNGNVTGISMITVALAPKRLQLLHDWSPHPPAWPCWRIPQSLFRTRSDEEDV